MQYYYVAALFAFASAQGFGGPGRGGPPNTYPGLPSCLSSCFTSNTACSYGDISCYCNATSISNINSCIDGSSCGSSDKEGAYEAIAQLCVNSGASVTASPEASFSATSGGSAWPTQWTTDGYYASAWSSWKSQTTGGPGPFGGQWGPGSAASGWSTASGRGPFGQGNGWGPYGSGAWTTGPWTQWWGTGACPPSTWSGWTSGSWSATPSWTAWTACTATTTATSVVTSTVTSSGQTSAVTSTSFGVKVDQATASASTTTPNGAMVTNFGVAGAAAGVIGVLAGAVLL